MYDGPQATRYALDAKFIQELEAEEITKPELKLKAYNWTTDHDDLKSIPSRVPPQYVNVRLLLNLVFEIDIFFVDLQLIMCCYLNHL